MTGVAWILLLVFVILKVTGIIAWSWWWTTFPITLPFFMLGVLGYITKEIEAMEAKQRDN